MGVQNLFDILFSLALPTYPEVGWLDYVIVQFLIS